MITPTHQGGHFVMPQMYTTPETVRFAPLGFGGQVMTEPDMSSNYYVARPEKPQASYFR